MEKWADHAAAGLAEAGYRQGGARAAVIELLDKQGCALSALEIEDQLVRDERRVSRASIYRVLEELEGLDMVTRLDLGGGLARFEATRPEGHHHHVVCDDCGDIVAFEDRSLERVLDRIANDVQFDITSHDVVLHGVCHGCRNR